MKVSSSQAKLIHFHVFDLFWKSAVTSEIQEVLLLWTLRAMHWFLRLSCKLGLYLKGSEGVCSEPKFLSSLKCVDL